MIVVDSSALVAILEKEADAAAYALAKTMNVALLFKGNNFTATDVTVCLQV